jgi:hypothetical protein
MENLQQFFTVLETKMSSLEEKERNKILNRIQLIENQLKVETIDYKIKNLQSNIQYYIKGGIERDIYFWKLGIKYKLFTSLSNYIDENDYISDITVNNGVKGLEISCSVKRLNEVYNFTTTCIEAGGHNIQCFHYRYIVTTKLSKIENKILQKIFKYKEDIERLEYFLSIIKNKPLEESKYSSIETIQKTREINIKSYERQISKIQQSIIKISK